MLRLPGFYTYIGETGRNLSTRLTEHKQVTRNGDVNNHIAKHHLQTKHQIDCTATCITYSKDYLIINNNNDNLILILRAFHEMIKHTLHDFYL